MEVLNEDSGVRADQVRVLEEGAAEPLAMLGCIRLVAHLAQQAQWRDDLILVVDSGSGTSAIGV